MNKRLIAFLSACSLSVILCACSNDANSSTKTGDLTSNVKIETIGEIDTYIKLSEQTTVQGDGVQVDGSTITINSAGTYSVSGALADGQLVVNADKNADVYILLDNADIVCSDNSAVNIVEADKVVIGTNENSENNLSDGTSYNLATGEDEPNATIFSKSDLVIIGDGTLNIKGNYNNGVTSKDDLRIQGGTINIESANHGMKGKDCVHISDGDINIVSNGDGIKSTNTEDSERGYIVVDKGNIDIISNEDGMQAETNLTINDGNIKIKSGGGSENSSTKEGWGNWRDNKNMNQPPNMQNKIGVQAESAAYTVEASTSSEETEQSAKAIKATSSLKINGGNIEIDSSDDAIHSNDTIAITGGNIEIASGDDGIHSDTSLNISGGSIKISKSYEGIESADIEISEGMIDLVASDDGVNISGGNDGSSMNDRTGENRFSEVSDGGLTINGGTLVVDASGDGLDSNGFIEMNDGLVVVNGPTNGGNGSLDYTSSFDVNGGTLIAAGSADMMQNPSDSSKQNIISIVSSTQTAKTLVHIEDSSGQEIITFEPTKQYASVVVSTGDIKDNETYKVYIGGESTGEAQNGIYSGGKYSQGEAIGSVEISQTVNSISTQGAIGGGMNPQMNENKGGAWIEI